jgi:hypothetical protein
MTSYAMAAPRGPGCEIRFAQKHLRSVRKGDRIFFYHTGKAHALKVLMAATSQNGRLLFTPIFSVYERGCSELEGAATAKAARTA